MSIHFTQRRARVALAVALVLLGLAGCATDMPLLRPSPFTEANIDKLHIGMPSIEVREMFGAPDEVRTAMCGASVRQSWVCETWKYGDHGKNLLTFNVSDGPKRLNDWHVKRD